MNPTRFIRFTQMIDTTQKCVKRLELSFAPLLGIKSVHVFWLYELLQHPKGLTATELAQHCMVDRSLISREINELKQDGLVEVKALTRSNYNALLILTDKGQKMAERIGEVAFLIQNDARGDISEQDILLFYATFEKILNRLIDITANIGATPPQTLKEGIQL